VKGIKKEKEQSASLKKSSLAIQNSVPSINQIKENQIAQKAEALGSETKGSLIISYNRLVY